MFLVLLHVASMVSLGQKYNDSTKNTTEMPHTVSGFSSGADMAMIHMVAFSSHVLGMGIVGGAPYGCNIMPNAGDTCGAMAGNFFNHIKKLTRFINLSRICGYVVRREQQSAVDKVVAQFFGLYCGPRAKRINWSTQKLVFEKDFPLFWQEGYLCLSTCNACNTISNAKSHSERRMLQRFKR